MNDDAFEKKLHALTGALPRPDPTPAWKADILARARREADAIPAKRMLPPRWLMLGWVAAWALVLALDFSAQRDRAADLALSPAASPSRPTATDPMSPKDELPRLIAFQRRLNLDLEPTP